MIFHNGLASFIVSTLPLYDYSTFVFPLLSITFGIPYCKPKLFLPRLFPEGNGRGQLAAFKLRVQDQLQGMTNGPIRAKHVNQSSSVIG